MYQGDKISRGGKKRLAEIAADEDAKQDESVQPSNIARRRKSALAEGSAEYKAKRDELVQLAAQLFKEKGYKATTLNTIAEHAGLDRATLYYYIGNKEELFRDAIKGILDANMVEAMRLMRAKTLDPRQKLQLLLERLMTSYHENYPHMYLYIQELMHEIESETTPWAKQMVQQTQSFEKSVTTFINQGVAQGLFRDDLPVRIIALALFGMFNWTHRWYKPSGKLTPKEIADIFSSILFDGITRPNRQDSKDIGRSVRKADAMHAPKSKLRMPSSRGSPGQG